MANQNFIHADEIAEELGVSKAYAYKIVQMSISMRQTAWNYCRNGLQTGMM